MIIAIDKLIALRRNPQYLSERQNKALRTSIERDGFLCPAVVRKKKDLYEILRDTMRTLFLDSALVSGIVDFDKTLEERLKLLQLPDSLNGKGNGGASIPNCVCKCGHRHIANAQKASKSSPVAITAESRQC